MKTVDLKLTSAIAMGGEIQRAGTVLENVPEAEAKNLLMRGKAVLATADDIPTQPAELVDELPADEPPADKPKRGARAKPEA